MTPDPIEQLSARLFEAARSETIPRGAEQRALDAVRRGIRTETATIAHVSSARKWLAAGACVALAATAALLLRPKDSDLGISAEPQTVARTQPVPRGTPSAAPSAAAPMAASDVLPIAPSKVPPIAPSLAVTTKPAASAAAVPARAAPPSLSDELSALKVASSALSAGDPKAALTALDRYDRVLKGQKLRAEATLLRLEALSRAGQAPAASQLAQRFVEQNPGSPLVDRARSFVIQ